MNNHSFRETVRYIFWCMAAALTIMVILANIAPFGASAEYDSGEDAEISTLGPAGRVEKRDINDESIQVIKDDLVYFSTEMPFRFDEATVTVTYSNPSEDQEIFLGYKDQADWHYKTALIDGLLDDRSWKRVGEGPFLYQKEQRYTSLYEFFASPPVESAIAVYNADTSVFPEVKVPNYQPTNGTVIDTPLRGKVVFYTYIENQPFDMTVAKQDLNWYENEDSVPVKIYKDNDVVYETTLPDDGIVDASKKRGGVQEERITNPGPDFPEAGVYRVEIGASGDTVVTRIETNFHKMVFPGPLHPVSNAHVYPGIVAETTPNTFLTDAKTIKATTYHPEAIQSIAFPESELELYVVNEPVEINIPDSATAFTIPQSDVIIETTGGFLFFEPSHYFAPFHFPFITVSKKEDLADIEYVISDYIPPADLVGWKVATHTFDLSHASLTNKKLSWLIKAPSIKEKEGEIAIKKIEVIFRKNPVVNL